MELNLQHTVLEGYQTILDTALSQEEVLESIVPDAFPDVSRIISTTGTAYLTTKQVGDSSAKIVGVACIDILYVPEEDSTARSIQLKIPFQCVADCPQINDSDEIHGTVLSVLADTRMVNPRKLFVKAEVKVAVKVYSRYTREVASDLACEENGTIQKQWKEYQHYSASAVLEKAFSFSDNLHLSSSKPAIDEMLSYRVDPASVEARYIGKKLVCKGEMVLSVLYRSDNDLCRTHFELPYSQILDLEGNYDEGEPDVMVALKNAECHLLDGSLDVSVEAAIQAALWSHRTVKLLCDTYSTAVPLDVERSENTICTMSEKVMRKESARKFCESGIPAKQVLSCSVWLNPVTAVRQEHGLQYTVDALADILYCSEDDAICNGSYVIPVTCMAEVPLNCSCSCSSRLTGDVIAVPVSGGFEVRFEVEFIWRSEKNEQLPCVSKVRKSNTAASAEQRPSVIIRMVGQNESLWDVAKACGAAIPDIYAANELMTEDVAAGTVLLVPTKR